MRARQEFEGLCKALPDTLRGEIITQDMAPNFRKGDYNGGLEAALNSIMNATREAFKGDRKTAAEKHPAPRNRSNPQRLLLLLSQLRK